MSNRASAARYAKALFDVALRESDPQQVERDLAAFTEVVQANEELRRALTNPAVPVGGKRGIIDALLARAKPAAPVAKLTMLLANRDRLELLPDLLNEFRERLMDHLKVVRAEVVTASPLPEDHAKTLQQRLAKVTGRQITMSRRVDPSIVGGVVARVGSTVYDGSIATHLEKMRDKLITET